MAQQPVTREGADRPFSRMEVINDIEANRIAEINKELEDSGSSVRVDHDPTPEIALPAGAAEPGDDDDAAGNEDNAGKPAASAAKPAANADADTIYEFLGEEKLPKTKVKIKVDGEERDVPVADLVRGHQKIAAADRRLEEAAIAKKQAEQVLADARAEAEQIKAAAGKPAAGEGKAADGGNEDELPSGTDAIHTAMARMYEGDQENAARILDAEINRRVEAARAAGATADPSQLVAKIKTDLSWDDALSAFNSEHEDVVSDPDLAGIFQRHLNEAAKTSATPKEAIKKATETFDSWRGKVSGRSGDTDGDKAGLRVDQEALDKRKADKAARDAVASNSSIRSPSRTVQDEQYDPSKVVQEMKAARGQE